MRTLTCTLTAFLFVSAGAAAAQYESSGRDGGDAREQSLDYQIRGDFFAGLLGGDAEAWARARETVEARLRAAPGDGEALAWKGSMLIAEAGRAFDGGDPAEGARLWDRGLEMMDRGVEREGGTPASRVPRGVTLLRIWQYEQDSDRAHEMLVTARDDLRESLEWLTPLWDRQSEHARGMLLLMLAEAEEHVARAGMARSASLRERLIEEMPGTTYAEQARAAMSRAAQVAGGGGADAADAHEAATPEAALTSWAVEMAFDASEGAIERALADDLQTGLAGDDAAWDRAAERVRRMASSSDSSTMRSLRGFVDVFASGRLFQEGKWTEAIPLWSNGLAALDAGVKASPGNEASRALRAATFLLVSQHERDAAKQRAMREHALADAAWLEERLEASGASASRRSAAALAQAMAHRALGETAEATASARRAIELDGSSPAAAIARSMLE